MTLFMRTTSSTTPLLLVMLMIGASLTPMVSADNDETIDEDPTFTGDLSNFNPENEGHEYIYNDGENPIYSAFGYLKQQWVENGSPNAVFPFSEEFQSSRGTVRNCSDQWSVGETDTFSTSNGVVTATVQKISANSAIFVEDGTIISSTTLNDITLTWETTIYPTNSNYFGTAPDVDNNCQIEILIFNIDNAGGIGGYFDPNVASQREILFVDASDLSWRNTILAHEFEHLLHNARDPFEYLWIDEGAADMAAYLCFGVTNTLAGHANEWSENTEMGVRWWNQRIADYGGGFMFLMYLADKLGGGNAISRLVADVSTGSSGIENLARNPEPGSTMIGTTMSDIFANFTAAVTLDSSQGAFGFDNIDMSGACVSGLICRAQLSGYNDQWHNTWTSPTYELEGWGMRSYNFASGSGAPLNLMVQSTQFGISGTVLAKDSATGAWSMSPLRIDSATGVGTSLVYGFGNTTSDVWVFVWYESAIDDCNYADCGTYPTTDITVLAELITDPSEVDIISTVLFDRDGNSLDDSIIIETEVISNAYFEIVELTFEAFLNNTLEDSINFNTPTGGSIATVNQIWFTPHQSGDWTFGVRIRDATGEVTDSAFTLPIQLANLEPKSTGSISTPTTQTWLSVNFFGAGYDTWGFSQENGSFSHNETPVSYHWSIGEDIVSGLKNPIHSFSQQGIYNISLLVLDQGGFYSEPQFWEIEVNDTSEPVTEISVEGSTISDELVLLTNQRVLFSAENTIDNVPHDQLNFTWNWGDGSAEGGLGLVEASHSYVDGSATGIVHTVTLTVSDGTHVVENQIYVRILNRVPRQIFDGELQTFTLTPLSLPDVFTDDDGHIINYKWTFEEGVNAAGTKMNLTSDFLIIESNSQNPSVGWKTPGLKNITIEVTDDDGNMSLAIISVTVLNQRPVAIFARPADGTVETDFFFDSSLSFDPDGDTSLLSTRWNITSIDEEIENVTGLHHTFDEPGLYTVSLTVIDERGAESATKSFQFRIENPLPVPIIIFKQPSLNGTVMSEIPDEGTNITWWTPFTSEGGAFIAPNCPLNFDGTASYDTDPIFTGRTSTETNDSDWNGITRWIWDFGDATPQIEGPVVWHQWERPGDYVVTLTVIDGFEGGDTNTTTTLVRVSYAPMILTENPIDLPYVSKGDLIQLNYSAIDIDLEDGLDAWLDLDDMDDRDGDGISNNDKDLSLTSDLQVNWDLNSMIDSDQDGDYRNDFLWGNITWQETGEIRIVMQVCDGVGVCSTKDFPIIILSNKEDNSPKSLRDLTWQDLIPNRDSGGLLALVGLVLLLGWLIMRQKDEEELSAKEMLETYDVQEVEVEGGLPGMDQHSPPPQPKYLSAEERRSKDSGYVRPIRTRRR